MAGFITGVLFSIYFNKDFKEDLSKPNTIMTNGNIKKINDSSFKRRLSRK